MASASSATSTLTGSRGDVVGSIVAFELGDDEETLFVTARGRGRGRGRGAGRVDIAVCN